MSVEAITWALRVPVGGTAKIILLGLANHASAEFDEARPAIDTLAAYAHCDRRTVQRNLRKLADDGWIVASGVHAVGGRADRAVNVWRLTGRHDVAPTNGAAPRAERGGTSDANGAAPVPPEPSIEPSFEPSRSAGAREDVKSRIPDGFPDELRPHAREVMRILRSVAEDHPSAKAVWPREVGLAIMAYPRRPLVEAAHDLAGWAVDAKRPIKDVVATYRTFLKRERDLAATERLADDGTPTTEAAARNGNVHPIRQSNGKPSPATLLAELNASNPRLQQAAGQRPEGL